MGAGVVVPTPTAYLAAVHTYWTGGMEFRVKVVTNKYISGRLLIRYVPYAAASGGTIQPYYTATADSCILDLSNESEVVLQIPWCQNNVVLPTALGSFTNPNSYNRVTDNGYVELIALTPLQTPLSTGVVLIYVWGRGSSDFQVMVPDNSVSENYSASGPDDLGREAVRAPRVCRLTAGVVRDSNPIKLVVGEDAPSIRALVKRYVFSTQADPLSGGILVSGQTYICEALCDQRPFDNARAFTGGTMQAGFLAYFSRLYLGAKGSMRYKVFSVPAGTTTYQDYLMVGGRRKSAAGNLCAVAPLNHPGDVSDIWQQDSARGAVVNNVHQGAIEITLPDFQPTLFRPAWRQVNSLVPPYAEPDAVAVTWIVTLNTVATGWPFMQIAEAAGEDFSLFWFQGCPLMTPL